MKIPPRILRLSLDSQLDIESVEINSLYSVISRNEQIWNEYKSNYYNNYYIKFYDILSNKIVRLENKH